MKKNILLLLSFFFFVHSSWAQIASGEITYKVEADETMMENILDDDQYSDQLKSHLRMMFSNQIRTLPYLFYQIEFNSKESLFKKMESMATDSGFDLDHTAIQVRSEEHTSELQSRGHLVCRLLLEKKKEK